MSSDLDVEDLLDLVADEVVHRLHVELGGEALLDGVDDRQLLRPLVRLGQQPAGLVEQPGVLEGDAQARGEGRQQPDVGFAEGVRRGRGSGARSRPMTSVADDERDDEPRFGWLALDRRRSRLSAIEPRSVASTVAEHQWLARSTTDRVGSSKRTRRWSDHGVVLDGRDRMPVDVDVDPPGRRRSPGSCSPTSSYIASHVELRRRGPPGRC